MTPFIFVVIALAAWRMARFLVEDELFSPVRDRIWARFPPDSSKIGYFFTCFYCSGFWTGALLVILYLLVPPFAFVVALIFAVSASVGIIQHLMER